MSRRAYPEAVTLNWTSVETAAGPVSLATDGDLVREIRLGTRVRTAGRPAALDREAARQLRHYFGGRLREFELPYRLLKAPFTKAVLEEVARIPFGETLAYGEVAALVGNPRGARAVGNAVGSNPLPLVIPCHRVLAANLRLGGFGGGLDWKRFLLRLEGVRWNRASRA